MEMIRGEEGMKDTLMIPLLSVLCDVNTMNGLV
jgi:hypothetical protein